MSYASKTSLGKMVELSKEYHAQVRALRADEEDAIQAVYMGSRKTRASAQTVNKVTTTSVDLEMDNVALVRETLMRGIIRWDLDGDPGDAMDEQGILTITAANLAKLTGGDRNKLFAAINELTEPPAEDEKKD